MESTFAIGISFNNADVTTRSAFSVSIEKQKECYDLAKVYQFKDFVVLSTCNRTEIYGNGHADRAEKIITTVCHQTKNLLDHYKFIKTSEDALTHIFQVASGLDSQILGDYQILGQFRNACRFSKVNGLLGPVFERMANVCIQASKEIKTKTDLSKGTVSSSFVAIEILKDKIGNLPAKCLLIGTGKFGNNISKNIKHYLPNFELTISNRTYSSASDIATANGFGILPFEKISDTLKEYDVVIMCAAADNYIINPENIKNAKTKLILDLSIPQTVHPDCKKQSEIEIMDIDSISAILDQSIEQRKLYLPLANEIINAHIASFIDWNNFYKERNQIVNLKNMLIDISKGCPHFSKMDDEKRNELVKKTIQTFVKSLKNNRGLKLEPEKIINDFIHFAKSG